MSDRTSDRPMEYKSDDAPILTDSIMAQVQPALPQAALPDIAASKALPPEVMKLVLKLAELGFKYVAEWIKDWSKSTTTYNSGSDQHVPVGRPLIFGFDHADDEANITFNDAHVAWKTGAGLTWHTSTERVKPGKNMLVLAVNNRGRLVWGTKVHVYDGATRQHIVTYNPWGNDGIFDNKHIYSVRIWGQ